MSNLSTMTNSGMYNILGAIDPGPLIQRNFELCDQWIGGGRRVQQGTGNLTFFRQTIGGDITEDRFVFGQDTSGNFVISKEHYTQSSGVSAASLATWTFSSKDLDIYGNFGVPGNKGIKVGGVQVVGAQQGAIADASQDLASVTTKLNQTLAALRAHGLIGG
jgi:hypothetical protein